MRRTRSVEPVSASDLVRELRALLDRYGAMSEHRKARPRRALIEAFTAVVRCGNASVKYVAEVKRYLERLLPVGVQLGDVTSVDLALALDDLQPRARSEAWCVLKRFFAWIVGQGDIARSPVDSIPKIKRVDVRTPRRALDEEEVSRLTGGAIPEERATFYMLATTTGLRVGRLERLRWSDIDFRRGLLSYRTKGQKMKLKPVPRRTVARLRLLHKTRKGEERVFSCAPSPRRFRLDLDLARIERETPEGRVDRHALRTTFCTRLGARGVNLQTAQGLMDHTDPKLTMKIYTRIPSEADRRAIEKGAAPRLPRSKGGDHAAL